MTPPDINPIAGNLSAQIEQAAQASYDELLRLIEEGTDPRQAVEQVLTTFNGTYITALSEAFSVVMQQRVTPQSVLAMPVGEVFLSARLYDMVQQTQGEVAAIVKQHARGLHDARQLARQLYDGYSPQDGIKRPLEGTARAYLPKALRELTVNPGPRQDLTQLFEQMQQQASRLKSPALKAGYLEALKDWERGKGREVLAKRLWVAEREKTRYMADRIAQTELARAYQDKVAGQIMADDSIGVVEVRLNPRHPLPDICDLHAKANLWGLGPGLYPKAKAPKPPFHPHCWCKLVTRPDIDAARVKEREDGAREFLRSLPPAEAARILGNRQRLDQVLGGADWERVTQASVRAEYRLRRVGEVRAAIVDTAIPGANQAVIPMGKIVGYALNSSHPVGKDKARVFAALGFTAENADALVAQILEKLPTLPAAEGKVSQYGKTFNVDVPVVGSLGSGVVRTGWILESGSIAPRLVTMFVLKEKT